MLWIRVRGMRRWSIEGGCRGRGGRSGSGADGIVGMGEELDCIRTGGKGMGDSRDQ